jgi:DNA-binding GntR family transcriptional regulator
MNLWRYIVDISKKFDDFQNYPTRKEIVLQKIREDLLTDKLVPEQVLNITELAEKYNVSITPVREALTYLESIGLVEKVNYKNIKVAKFLSDEVEEIYYMRSALSGLAARNAALHMTKEEKDRLAEIVRTEQNALNTGEIEQFHKTNSEFHGMLSGYIKTPLLRNLDQQFYIVTRRHQIFGFKVRNYEELIEEHKNICEAVCAGDSNKAEEYGRIHYINNIRHMKEYVEQELKKQQQ